MGEPPGPDRVKHAPGHDTNHDPANDPLRPGLRRCAHEVIVCSRNDPASPATTGLSEGPADDRGALGRRGPQRRDVRRARAARARDLPKGPRNGPGTRGAENLDRFRERLDGTRRGPLTRGRRRASVLPLTSRGESFDSPLGLQASGTVGMGLATGQGRSTPRFSEILTPSGSPRRRTSPSLTSGRYDAALELHDEPRSTMP